MDAIRRMSRMLHGTFAGLRQGYGAALTRRSLKTLLLAGVIAHLTIFAALVAWGVTGTSIGFLHAPLFPGGDANVISGDPQPIRSDEWYVATPLILSQVQQNLPLINDAFPGGMDVSVVWDAPYREWSTILRPHMWGFFTLPLDSAFAFKWWLPLVALSMSVYMLAVTLWRRPVAALLLAVGFCFSPFIQWWFQSTTIWALTFGVALAALTVLATKATTRLHKWGIGILIAYTTAVSAATLYPAFLVPCGYAGVAFGVGWLIWSGHGKRRSDRLAEMVPIVIGVIGGGLITAVFLLTRIDVVRAVLTTAYPGERLWSTGESANFGLQWVFSGVFQTSLERTDLTGFAPNPSEGSSFLYVGFFLVPAALWIIGAHRRRFGYHDALLIALLACVGLFFAHVYIPGWNWLSHLLLLDRSTEARIVIGLGLLSLFLVIAVAHRVVVLELRPPWWVALLSVALLVFVQTAVLRTLNTVAPQIVEVAPRWMLISVVLAMSVALYSRGNVAVAGLGLLAVSLVIAGRVNPLYQGVLNLNDAPLAREILSINEADPGNWIGVGRAPVTSTLRATGVVSYSGVQAWPSLEMWAQIDPTAANEMAWNRYAHINWNPDPAAEALVLEAADSLILRLDSCDEFAQQNADHVVSDKPLNQECLTERSRVLDDDSAGFWIYDVVPR